MITLKVLFLNMILLTGIQFRLFAQDTLLSILSDEMNRETHTFNAAGNAPYFISYRVDDVRQYDIVALMGVVTKSENNKSRMLKTQVRSGSMKLDNTHELRSNSYDYSYEMSVYIPIENNPEAIKQVIWKDTDAKYKKALIDLGKVEANVAVMVEVEDTSDDFSSTVPEKFSEPPIELSNIKFSVVEWENKLKNYSALFLEEPNIYKGKASLSFQVVRRYFISSEGAEIVQNLTYSRIFIEGEVKADDGMELPLYLSYFAFKPSDLPNDQVIMNDIRLMIEKLKLLRVAPVVEPFTGPAILSGEASGVFFHEIFGHRIEGHRQKSEYEGQTFKKKIGQPVINEQLSVYFDPQLKQYAGNDLNGYYRYDDEGVKGKRVDVIKDGILNEFLMSRSPISGFINSNGHGRASPDNQPVSRQSNMIITTKKYYSKDELRKMLIDECKKQKLEYGYLFAEVRGGFTMTGRFMPNSFNVLPLLVYRIYVDGRPDELVRGVDLVGTPLSMFSQIQAAGGDLGLFTGYCGAESGSVPVSSVSPAVFVKQIEMQKKSKSQDRPFILPRPGKKQSD